MIYPSKLASSAQRPPAQRLRPATGSVKPRIPASGSKSAAA